jgi:hypothetical protein
MNIFRVLAVGPALYYRGKPSYNGETNTNFLCGNKIIL